MGLCHAIPIIGGALMVGLGCEVFQIGRMKEDYGIDESDMFQHHDHPGDRRHAKTVERGVERDQGDAADGERARSARRCRPRS